MKNKIYKTTECCHEKGTLGWLRERAKKDGFDNIRDWQNWKRKKINEKIRNGKFDQSSWTKENVVDLIIRTYNNTEKVPIRADFDSYPENPSTTTINNIFGSWNNAIIAAGLENLPRRQLYDKKQIIEMIIKIHKDTGKIPRCIDFDNDCNLPSSKTVMDYFGDWNNAIEAAGLVVKPLKYKIYVKISEQNKFWVVVDNSILIKNPTEEDMKDAKLIEYNQTNICSICMEEYEKEGNELTDKGILNPWNCYQKADTKECVCRRHWYHIEYKKRPNSQNNIIKQLRDRRTGNLDPNSTQQLGDDGEELTKLLLGADKLSEIYDNFELPDDHGPITKHISVKIGNKIIDLYGMIPQTKTATFRYDLGASGGWTFGSETNKKEFDILILYCISKDGINVDRIYIIPKEDAIKRSAIGILENPSRRIWYYIYRIRDKLLLELADELWEKIISR